MSKAAIKVKQIFKEFNIQKPICFSSSSVVVRSDLNDTDQTTQLSAIFSPLEPRICSMPWCWHDEWQRHDYKHWGITFY